MKITISSARNGAAVLKWVAILAFVALGALAGIFYLRDSNARVQLQQAIAQAEEYSQQLAQQQPAQTPTQPKSAEDNNNSELVKLRGEVVKYRAMEKQYQTLQTEVQQLRGTIQELQKVNSEAAVLRNQNAQFQQAAQDQASTVQCIANLRSIANAKAQWAAQNGKGPNDTPMDVDIFGRYLPQKPVCPKGGIYTLGTAGSRPTCSVQGHTM